MLRCFQKSITSFSTQKNKVVTLLPGHGVGPEISAHVVEVFRARNIPITFEKHDIHTTAQTKEGDFITHEAINSIKANKFALKGPLATPIGKGYRSLNITLRKKFNLYANVRPCKSIPGIKTPYDNVDVITIRENTEGEYSGLEHEVVPGVVENLKIISKKACREIAEYAFKCASDLGRKKVTVCHKASIMKLGDGLFLDTCQEVSQLYPQIIYEEEQIDTVCMQLSRHPEELDLMVMPNLYGDIVSDLCAGLIGGLGLTPSANIGHQAAIYEAVHGTAPDIAGKDLANPSALLLSSTMMLKDMGYSEEAESIKKAMFKTFEEGKYLTGDLGGKSTGTEFTKAVIGNLE